MWPQLGRPPRLPAQTFDSGSDGSDGALNLAPNLGTIVFDPNDTVRWEGRVLDADGDGVFNFTTITIGGGTTLTLTANRVVRPIYWLAQGDVSILGNVVLDGAVGYGTVDDNSRRQPSVPGSGGFAGGIGAWINYSTPTPGGGPGGGGVMLSCFAGSLRCGQGGTFSGNRYLIAMVGGSGGGGALWDSGYYNGGAGGGAILIASSTSITLSGRISARGGGGGGNVAGGGSGGGIRLVAPTLVGGGSNVLDVTGGPGNGSAAASHGSAGLIRLERFTQSGSFGFLPNSVWSQFDRQSMPPHCALPDRFASRQSPVSPW